MPTSAASSTAANVTIADMELHADNLDPRRAAEVYHEHGCLVVRGLQKQYVEPVKRDIELAVQQAIAMLPQAEKITEGWRTPDNSLFLPAPPHYKRAQQIMVVACNYRHSAALFQSALDKKTIDIVEQILGPDVELFMDGQCLYKEPVGGHPKNLHQDGAYFEHKFEGPVAILNYAVDTDLNNGALFVVPGSHKLGMLKHVDTFSHLGLDEHEWPWERALPIIGKAGDAIFFHVKTIHGSKENYSTEPRPVFIHRYRRADDYIVIQAATTEKRVEAEKQSAKAKKENQLGLMVRGIRRFHER